MRTVRLREGQAVRLVLLDGSILVLNAVTRNSIRLTSERRLYTVAGDSIYKMNVGSGASVSVIVCGVRA